MCQVLSGVNIVVSTILVPGPVIRAAIAADVVEYAFHIDEDSKLRSDQMSGILRYLRHNKVGNATLRYTLFTTRRALHLRQRSQTKPVRTAPSKLPAWSSAWVRGRAPGNFWQCHICHAGPYFFSNTPVCVAVLASGYVCHHQVCDQCKVDSQIPNPLT